MSLNHLAPFILKGCLVGAAGVGAMVVMPVPEVRAACIGGNSPCLTFDPTTVSTPTLNNFAGNGNASVNYSYVRIRFQLDSPSGAWNVPTTLSGISLTGQGITGSLSFADVTINGIGSGNRFQSDKILLNAAVSGGALNLSNNTLSFVIPAGEATTGATLLATVQYSEDNLDDDQVVTSTGGLITAEAAEAVPAPLPILGAAAAFGFSRKLRRRIRQSA